MPYIGKFSRSPQSHIAPALIGNRVMPILQFSREFICWRLGLSIFNLMENLHNSITRNPHQAYPNAVFWIRIWVDSDSNYQAGSGSWKCNSAIKIHFSTNFSWISLILKWYQRKVLRLIKYLLDWLKTKIKYLLFGLKTKISPKIFFCLRKLCFCCLESDPESGSGLGKKIQDPDPYKWIQIRYTGNMNGLEGKALVAEI